MEYEMGGYSHKTVTQKSGFHISLILSQTWISKRDNSETQMRGLQIVMPRL